MFFNQRLKDIQDKHYDNRKGSDMATKTTPEEFFAFLLNGKTEKIGNVLKEGLTLDHFLYKNDYQTIDDALYEYLNRADNGRQVGKVFYDQRKELLTDVFATAVYSRIAGSLMPQYRMSEQAEKVCPSMEDLYFYASGECHMGPEHFDLRPSGFQRKNNNDSRSLKALITSDNLRVFIDAFSNDYKRLKALMSQKQTPSQQITAEQIDEAKLIWNIEETKLNQIQKTLEQGLPFACYAAVDGDGVGILDIAEQTALSLPQHSFKRKDAEEIVSLLREGRKEALKKDVLPVLKMATISLEREDSDEKYRMSLSARRKLHDFIKIYRTSLLTQKDKSALGVLQKAVMVLSAQAYAPKENISAWLKSKERKEELQTRIEPYTLNKLQEFVAAYTDEAQQIKLVCRHAKSQENNMLRKGVEGRER